MNTERKDFHSSEEETNYTRKFPERSQEDFEKLARLSQQVCRNLVKPTNRLIDRNASGTYINRKIFHFMCDPRLYINAYVRISKNKGALTKGNPNDKEVMKLFG
jgi:hypothetical protein